jgi:DNA-directed RNA polymerase subunit beta'
VETDEADNVPIQEDPGADGTVTKLYNYRRVREDANGNRISQYIKTTAGRIIYNKAIQESLMS